jgi:hypothetical protein
MKSKILGFLLILIANNGFAADSTNIEPPKNLQIVPPKIEVSSTTGECFHSEGKFPATPSYRANLICKNYGKDYVMVSFKQTAYQWFSIECCKVNIVY